MRTSWWLLGVALAAPPEPVTTAPLAPSLHQAMAERLRIVSQAREAVIAGNMEGVHDAARALERVPAPPTRPEWADFVVDLQLFTTAARGATSVAEAADAVAAVTQACARCHERAAGGPDLTSSALPPVTWSSDVQMSRHAWAMSWLGLGLLKPNDDAWRRGAQQLADEPPPTTARSEEIVALEAQLRELGARAVTTQAGPDRSVVYAQLLTTCARCHMRREGE